MFGKIKYISDNIAHIENIAGNKINSDLMNIHVIFEAPNQRILGEVEEINSEVIKVRFLGEYIEDKYISGVIRKPSLASSIRIINNKELLAIVGTPGEHSFILGRSAIYKEYNICANINSLFSNHFAIFGNSGSGKSCGVARIVQNIFANHELFAYNANLFIFDAYGEYKNAFSKINEYNANYSYKFITTNPKEPGDALLQVPAHLLTLDDYALLLQCEAHSQLPILERTLRLTKIFAQKDERANSFKNHLIAKALLAVIFSNETTAMKKNDVFRIIEACSTPEFNFTTQIQGIGYTRSFAECFEIDSNGNFAESVLINEYIMKFIKDDIEETPVPKNVFYTLKDFRKALDFTLISEGFQNNNNLYDNSIILKVRLNAILNSHVANYFTYNGYITSDNYISSLVAKDGKKAQVININLEDIDDVYAKVIVKILARLFFDFAKSRQNRASIPFHLFLEEAHRYIQKDSDTFLIGYNIFDRIAKEGRKYGVLLNIISQRPVELSDTVISQISNFLIFKMTHPRDIDYIQKMLPNISADIIEKQKVLQPGSCVAFGGAFKVPLIAKLELPNPLPYSTNCDVQKTWKAS